jgi:transcriptional regulator with XRE-family HTH domain
MTRVRIDVRALYSALDQMRRSKNLSWRDVAGFIGCSPSTITRLAGGNRPDVEVFMSLADWLAVPAETFTVTESR